jgi:tetratricopeptide (TPR) repeat protein
MANGRGHPTLAGSAGRFDEALQRAVLALNGRRPIEAERIAAEVLKADPRHTKALHIFGCALVIQGRAAEAIAPLETAARSRPDPEIDTELAIALRQIGRHEDAVSRLKRAIKRKPPHADAFRELGYLLVALERYDEAVDVLAQGLEVAPMMPQLSIQLGYAYLSLRDCAKAKVAFARALQIVPGSPDALFGMAKAHQEIGENRAAADYFRRALVSKPDDQATWLHLGHCLLELGELDAGYDCFRTAARGEPTRYGDALSSLAASARGRFWLKPSAAARFMRREKS